MPLPITGTIDGMSKVPVVSYSVFFFASRRRHTIFDCDWSSDVCSSDLLILDEPCAGLDPVAREHFLQFLDRLGRKRSAPTVVLVTHHVEEIMPVFSHVLLLKAGQVLAAGKKQDVLRSQVLSEAFASSLSLLATNGRYSLVVKPSAKRVM